MNHNEILKNIRLLINNQQPEQDISEILMKHNYDYLLRKCTNKFSDDMLNKIYVNQRYKSCENIFRAFEDACIPYAVIKGAVLSKMAYNDEFCRRSGDIDVLISKKNIDIVKQIMFDNNFVQGKVTDNDIVAFTRQELLFQVSMSHQTAPFIKKTSNPICPYVNTDINFDIFWGEQKIQTDMDYVLRNTESIKICNISIQKLIPEMEFISLCLHNYKDANSIYLLWEKSLNISLFCDIYFYLKNNQLNIPLLKEFCCYLHASDYVYYCIYYAYKIFEDSLLKSYLKELKTKTSEDILHTFGLSKHERKNWNISFFERLFADNLQLYLRKILTQQDFDKIKINTQLM